jgi:trans-aconitate 2-methyltransferase
MSEWNGAEYARGSQLQETMASEALSLLTLHGDERVLDVGCGDGRITARIASGLPDGSVVGVDPSASMIEFATERRTSNQCSNLHFELADARRLPYRAEFDLIVSFNALHWIPDQDAALYSIRDAMKPDGRALLRLVPAGERKSLENVVEETRRSAQWTSLFTEFDDPYLHLTAAQYAEVARHNGFRVVSVHTEDKAWDFQSRAAFAAFCSMGLGKWTRRIPPGDTPAFINDVLDRYAVVVDEPPRDVATFRFYQMDIALARGAA